MKRNTKRVILIVLLLALAVLLVLALKFYHDVTNPAALFNDTATPAPTQAPTPAPSLAPDHTPAPTPEPTPTIDPEVYLSGLADTDFMKNRVNVLVLGIDESAERESWGSFRTDTMLLTTIDFDNNDVDMISVPRDSYVKIYDGEGLLHDELAPYAKINSAFSSGGGAKRHGFAYTCTTVSKLLDVPVNYYVAFNMNVVKDVVNAMGGIDYEVDVVVDMNGRHYDIGMQHLDGQGVLDYCRQRKGSSDIARIDRQQRMLMAIFQKLKSTGQIANIPNIYKAVQANMDTNLSFEQISSLALIGVRMDLAQLDRHTLAGKAVTVNGQSCWGLDTLKLTDLIKEVFGAKSPDIDYENDYEFIMQTIVLAVPTPYSYYTGEILPGGSTGVWDSSTGAQATPAPDTGVYYQQPIG